MEGDRKSRSASKLHGRRAFIEGAVGAAVATTLLRSGTASAAEEKSLAASPPAGFTPLAAPGRIVRVTKADSLQANKRYPKEDDAKAMLSRAMTEFTGKSDIVEATKLFIHPNDIVCVKVNGIAESNMGTNKELVLPFLEAMIAAGVKPENITVLEQYGSFLAGTRVNAQNVPKGVKVTVHNNSDATMKEKLIDGTGVRTKFVRPLTEATAVVNFSLIKDHSIHGYTGLMKNMTHGCQILPHHFHAKPSKSQIARLYNDEIIKSRVRLAITDGFKIMANGGPLWKSPRHVIPHESVYVTTDVVAMDTLGYELVEKARADFGLKTLKDEGREPGYIKLAADLGLGVGDRAQIQLKEVTISAFMGADVIGWRNCTLQSELGTAGFLGKLKLVMYKSVFETQVPREQRDRVRIKMRVTGRPERELAYADVVGELAEFEAGIPECAECPLSRGRPIGCYAYVTFPVDEALERTAFEHFCADASLQGSASWRIAQNVVQHIPAQGTPWHLRRATDALHGGLATLARPLEATIGWQRVDSAQLLTSMFITVDTPGPLAAYAGFYTGLVAHARARGAIDGSRSLTEIAKIEPLYRVAAAMVAHGYSMQIDA